MQKLIAKTLEQRGRNSSLDRRFQINAQNFLDIQVGLKTQAFRYPINILLLDARSVETKELAWNWILASCLLCMLTLAFAYLYVVPLNTIAVPQQITGILNTISPWKTELLAIITCLMLMSILISMRKTQRFTELKTRYGQIAVVRFLKDIPNKTAVDEFIREIRHRQEQLTKKTRHNEEKLLSAELEGLRNLRDHKIVSDKAYTTAKQTIMKIHATLDRDAINKSKKKKLGIAQYQ